MKFTRIPVKPLEYSERHKAVCKELLIKYETGDIYVVSPDNPDVLIDITEKIRTQIKDLKGANISVTIPGIGIINLQELMSKMQKTINSSVTAYSIGKDIKYVSNENVLDERSVNTTNNNIELYDFSKADDNTIPVKRDGKIQWIPMISTDDGSMNPDKPEIGGTTTSDDNYNGSNGEIIQPANPDDGFGMKCIIIDPSDHKLYLKASRRQKTLFPTSYFKAVLPTPLDEKVDIEWMIVTNDVVPEVTFPNNIFWDELPGALLAHTMHVYTFKTWDGGRTWCGSVRMYNSNAVHTIITKEFLENNYYNKEEIDDMLEWEDNSGDNNESFKEDEDNAEN